MSFFSKKKLDANQEAVLVDIRDTDEDPSTPQNIREKVVKLKSYIKKAQDRYHYYEKKRDAFRTTDEKTRQLVQQGEEVYNLHSKGLER